MLWNYMNTFAIKTMFLIVYKCVTVSPKKQYTCKDSEVLGKNMSQYYSYF